MGARPGYFNEDYNALGNDASAARVRQGQGRIWIGGDWDSTIIKTGLGASERRRDADPARAERPVDVDRRPLRPVAHLREDEVPGPRRGVAQLRDHLAASEGADVLAAADPVRQARQGAHRRRVPGVRSSKAFQLVANDDGLLLYTDWASPSMYTTLQNQFQLLLAGRQTPAGMAKAVQDDWAKFDKTLR